MPTSQQRLISLFMLSLVTFNATNYGTLFQFARRKWQPKNPYITLRCTITYDPITGEEIGRNVEQVKP